MPSWIIIYLDFLEEKSSHSMEWGKMGKWFYKFNLGFDFEIRAFDLWLFSI